jgi:hypothetical protein
MTEMRAGGEVEGAIEDEAEETRVIVEEGILGNRNDAAMLIIQDGIHLQ